jgi:SAM-dependent methyltransferase
MFRPRNPEPTPLSQSRLAQIPIAGRAGIDVATSPYPLPNTLEEAKRLDLQHFIFHEVLHTNLIAPYGQTVRPLHESAERGRWTSQLIGQLQQQHASMPIRLPQQVLDVGCGTGRWAIEVARQFPLATVVGVDIVAPARPFTDQEPTPPNFAFHRGNVLQGLALPEAGCEYVHMRCLGMGIPATRWQSVLEELVRLVAPGGWVESVECGLPSDGGPMLTLVYEAFGQVLHARGIALDDIRTVDSLMRRTQPSLNAIQSRLVEIPIGAHGGSIGLQMAWNCLLAIRNMGGYLQQGGFFLAEEWEALVQAVDQELHQMTYHPMLPVFLALGQRPA